MRFTKDSFAAARPHTSRLLNMMDSGSIDPRTVADLAIGWLSDSSVGEMIAANMLFEDEEEEEESEEDEETTGEHVDNFNPIPCKSCIYYHENLSFNNKEDRVNGYCYMFKTAPTVQCRQHVSKTQLASTT
jgi:hypothetical protein